MLSTPPAFVLSQDQTLHRKLIWQKNESSYFAFFRKISKSFLPIVFVLYPLSRFQRNAYFCCKNSKISLIGIDLCTLLSSQGTGAQGHGRSSRFQGEPPNLVERLRIDKSWAKPSIFGGNSATPALKPLKIRVFRPNRERSARLQGRQHRVKLKANGFQQQLDPAFLFAILEIFHKLNLLDLAQNLQLLLSYYLDMPRLL